MKTFLIIWLAFWAGYQYSKWDQKHGAEFGYKVGHWTRVNILKLPPIEKEPENETNNN